MANKFADKLKKLKIPHVFALLTIVIFICSLLTYVIPSGAFERQEKEIDGRKRTLVVAGTYTHIPKHYSLAGAVLGEKAEGKASPTSLHGFLSAIARGMESAADIIFFIFIIGGVFGILQKSGVIIASIHKLLQIFGDYGPLLTAVIMLVLAAGGSTLGMGEEFIPLVPIFLIVSKRMGYDRVYGMAMVILAAQVGFASATTNPFTVAVAQGISELPLYSGALFRVVFFLTAIGVTILYLLRYGAKIKKDPAASVMVDDPFEVEGDSSETEFNRRHGWILTVCIAIFALILYAVVTMGWWMADMAGGFFLMGMLTALIARIPLGETTRAFVKGMEGMVVCALVVGFAKGIEVVLSDAQIMDTIIHFAANQLENVPRFIAVQGMFLFQACLNFLIPSGSGQAAVTMPLMAPLADVIGVTRQTAVFAFQCGDGFSNTVIPTSGILMSMLALAKIPYERWLRFMLPLLLQLVLLSALFLTIAVLIGYK